MDETQNDSFINRQRSPWLARISAFVVVASVAVLFVPSLLSLAARDWVLRNVLQRPRLSASANSASFGWFSSQRMSGVQVTDDNKGIDVAIDWLSFNKSLWQLLTSSREGQELSIRGPKILIDSSRLLGEVFQGPKQGGDDSALAISVADGAFSLRNSPAEPSIVELTKLNLTTHIWRDRGVKVFVAEPAIVLDHEELTTDLCHRGLHLVAPILSDAANVSGNASLRIDKLRIPLEPSPDGDDSWELSGFVTLHQVTAGIRSPLLKDITGTASRFLRLNIPDNIQIADEADIRFFVKDNRVFHEGLAFGLPEISPDLQIRTSGWVGFDRSLDLVVDIPVPLNLVRNGPLMRKLSEQPLRLHVRGSLDQPEITLPDDRTWYEELTKRLLEPTSEAANSERPTKEDLEPLAEAMLDTLGDLLERRRVRSAEKDVQGDESPGTPHPLLDRFRSWRDRRKQTKADEASSKSSADELQNDQPKPVGKSRDF